MCAYILQIGTSPSIEGAVVVVIINWKKYEIPPKCTRLPPFGAIFLSAPP